MYKIHKTKGYKGTITVENMNTQSSVDIGVMTSTIQDILNKRMYVLSDSSMMSSWDIGIDKETANELTKLALPMNKPVRKKKQEPKKNNKGIDAMDVLLGLANYN